MQTSPMARYDAFPSANHLDHLIAAMLDIGLKHMALGFNIDEFTRELNQRFNTRANDAAKKQFIGNFESNVCESPDGQVEI